jgi:hypothetical protein
MNAVRGMGSLLLQVGLRKSRPSVASLAMSALGLALVGVVGVLVAREARRGAGAPKAARGDNSAAPEPTRATDSEASLCTACVSEPSSVRCDAGSPS